MSCFCFREPQRVQCLWFANYLLLHNHIVEQNDEKRSVTPFNKPENQHRFVFWPTKTSDQFIYNKKKQCLLEFRFFFICVKCKITITTWIGITPNYRTPSALKKKVKGPLWLVIIWNKYVGRFSVDVLDVRNSNHKFITMMYLYPTKYMKTKKKDKIKINFEDDSNDTRSERICRTHLCPKSVR